MSQKRETLLLFWALLITLFLIFIGIQFLSRVRDGETLMARIMSSIATSTPKDQGFADIEARISFGEKNLLPTEDSTANNQKFRRQKARGIEAIANGQYFQAVFAFEQALQQYPNAPETLIYLNNARIGDTQAYTIATVVPIGGPNSNGALEMLRGVAQAQLEINAAGGINGVPLKLAIVNDDDNPDVARQLATMLVNDGQFLAVTGHWTSDVSLAAAAVYDASKLVFITPISTTTELSHLSPYVFRTTINNYGGGKALAEYTLNQGRHQKVAIFFASNVTYSEEIRTEFAKSFSYQGGEIVAEFDFSDPHFSAHKSVEHAIAQAADMILLATNNTSVDKALQVVQANRRRIDLMGDLANLYSNKTLEVAGNAAIGMVMAIAWHIEGETQSNFPQRSRQLWQADVNYATAMSYDAMQVLITALKRNPTRAGIQQTLKAPDFSAPGAATTICFLPSGDRQPQIQLVEIQKVNQSRSGTGFDFIPIKSGG
ncbi:MAG: ABC transporter substrate-binding protein [Cyanothece sp. SIO1E1]|nr:ABC transporter substrate-binding protein [Cyanothece sp. SIO1E1]